MKKILVGIGVALTILLALVVGRVQFVDNRNATVADELRRLPHGERALKSMLIYLPDGRMYPVNYLQEADVVFMGIDGFWWRSFQGAGTPVRMLIRGAEYHGHARVILDDPAYVEDVFSRLRPTVPSWLPDWLNGKLVEIRLHQPAADTATSP